MSLEEDSRLVFHVSHTIPVKEKLEALVTILQSRYKLSKLVGYPSHAHRILHADSFMKKPGNVFYLFIFDILVPQ